MINDTKVFSKNIYAKMERLLSARSVAAKQAELIDFEHLILNGMLNADDEDEIVSSLSKQRVRAVQKAISEFESTIERRMAMLARMLGLSLFARQAEYEIPYLARYRILAERELKSMSVKKKDHVLFIGSGPFPISAIEYVRQTGCAVCCLEKVREIANSSKRLVDVLGMSEKIKVHHGQGQSWDMSGYSKIVIGVLAVPKLAIVRNIERNADQGAIVLMRTTFGFRQLIYRRASIPRLLKLSPSGISSALGDQVISNFTFKVKR